jgi:RNA polymerase sigma-54 factor
LWTSQAPAAGAQRSKWFPNVALAGFGMVLAQALPAGGQPSRQPEKLFQPCLMFQLNHSLNQSQKRQFSTQMQKAVGLLQMPNAVFAETIQATLSENPFLEGDDVFAEAQEAAAQAAASQTGGSEPDGAEGMSWAVGLQAQRPPREGGVALDALAFLAAPTRLQDHLHAQLRVKRMPDRMFLLASIVCESLDDDGYLRSDLHEIETLADVSPPARCDELEAALLHVQALEPAGVGARDTIECLRLQLAAIGDAQDRDLCEQLLQECAQALQTMDLKRIAAQLGCTAAKAQALVQCLRRLDPHPGWRYGSDSTRYVQPDVLAKKTRGGWKAVLNDAVVPRIRVNQQYAELYRAHGAANAAINGQLSEAKWTVRNVHQRFSTILSVAQAIIARQHRFLDYGPMAMRPLALRDIAEEVGVHESTVSRVTHQKYIATPIGTFELGYFFSRGMVTQSGTTCSPTAVRGLVAELIAREDGLLPLSDVAITRVLERQGITVARRTVTKYRQQLGIRTAELRAAA